METPRATFGGEYLHSDLFLDGGRVRFPYRRKPGLRRRDKRAGLDAALVFLLMNGWEVIDERGQLYDAMIAIAVRQLDKPGFARLLQELARPDEDESPQAS